MIITRMIITIPPRARDYRFTKRCAGGGNCSRVHTDRRIKSGAAMRKNSGTTRAARRWTINSSAYRNFYLYVYRCRAGRRRRRRRADFRGRNNFVCGSLVISRFLRAVTASASRVGRATRPRRRTRAYRVWGGTFPLNY